MISQVRLGWVALLATFIFCAGFSVIGHSSEVAITIDDISTGASPKFEPRERDAAIRRALSTQKIKAALFVCGIRVDDPTGVEMLGNWSREGHLIGNHSYSHLFFHKKSLDFAKFSQDLVQVEPQILNLPGFQKFFRFPFLKEGDTLEKRDQMRAFLKGKGYRNGYVTIDASDWAIDDRLTKKLRKDRTANVTPYRDFYLKHIWSRAQYYDDLAFEVLGRRVRHTLLIHHSLLNTLFLGDLLEMFKSKGWQLIDAAKAYEDPLGSMEPKILPAGESLIWALAKETGKFEKKLRYPGEDGEFEVAEMDRLGL